MRSTFIAAALTACTVGACFSGTKGGEGPILNASPCKNESLPDGALVDKINSAFVDFRGGGYEKDGKIRYRALKDSPEWAAYEDLAGCLRRFDPSTLETHEQKLAFWINMYNGLVVHGVLAAGIPASVTDVESFFDNTAYEIGGVRFSLEHIEHGVLRGNRPKYLRPWSPFPKDDPVLQYSLEGLDPRIHFALVCGAQSCPPVRGYSPDEVDEQLDAAARDFVNATVTLSSNKKALKVSSILQWYEADFGGRQGVLELLRRWIEPEVARQILETQKKPKISYSKYDWRLNDLP
ncbi:MAG: DUF547 domain-containing protein [Acidobacteriota bacterium]